MTRTLNRTNALLALGLIGYSIWAWPQLPEQLPVHFGPDGQPTRWAARSFWSWFGPPLIGLGVVAINYGLARVAGRYPALVNLPDKKRFLELPPERREAVLDPARDLLYAANAGVLLIFVMIQLSTFREAIGASGTPYVIGVLIVALLLTPVLLIVFLPRIQHALAREWQAHRNEAS